MIKEKKESIEKAQFILKSHEDGLKSLEEAISLGDYSEYFGKKIEKC